jgi:hypothetical protein
MDFEEALKMEARMKPCVEEILKQYPIDIKRVDFYACKGVRTNNNGIDALMDKLGFDAILNLDDKESSIKTVQVKVGTRKNFKEYGMDRQSFVIGNIYDINMKRALSKQVKSYDLMLTGYELKDRILSPYVLIVWPWLIRAWLQGTLKINEDRSGERKFGWVKHEDLFKANVVVQGCSELKAFYT